MTYLAQGRLDRQLSDAIYAGAPVATRRVAARLRRSGVVPPFHVVAIQHGDASLPDEFARMRAPTHLLRITPGMAYISIGGRPDALRRKLRRLGLLHGEPVLCRSYGGWVGAIQTAVLRLRDQELQPLFRVHGTPTESAERRARQDAVGAFRSRNWQAPLQRWAEIAQLLRLRKLEAVRRAFVTMLGLLTADVPETDGLENAFGHGVRALQATFCFTDLRQVLLQAAQSLRTCVLQSQNVKLPRVDALIESAASTPLRQALQTMRKHFAEPLTLAAVAEAAHVSEFHLSRLFRRDLDRTFSECLQIARINAACQRLRDSDAGLLSVALDVGFGSPEHFHRVFRKWLKTTPRRWRRHRFA